MADFKERLLRLCSIAKRNKIQDIENIDIKIAISFAVLIFLLMLLVLILTGMYFTQTGEDEETRLGNSLSQALLKAVQKTSFSGKYQTRLFLQEVVAQQNRIVHLIIQKPDGQIYAHSDPSFNNTVNLDPHSQMALSLLIKKTTQNSRISEHHSAPEQISNSPQLSSSLLHEYQIKENPIREHVLVYRAGYGNQLIGVFRVGISTKEFHQQLTNGWIYLFSVIFCLFLLSIVGVYFLSHRLGKPIRLLAAQLLGILQHAPMMIAIFNQKNEVLLSSQAFRDTLNSLPEQQDKKQSSNSENGWLIHYESQPKGDQQKQQEQQNKLYKQQRETQLIETFLEHPSNGISYPQISHYEKSIDLNSISQTYYVTQFAIAHSNQLSSQHCFIAMDISKRKQLELHLEQLVTDRTQELENANHELKIYSDKIEKDKQKVEQSYAQLQQMQKQLLEAEKMSALGGLVAGVAHEINTPLGLGLTGVTFIQDQIIQIQESYQSGKMTEAQFSEFLNDTNEMINSAVASMHRAAKLIKSFKQIAVSQSHEELQNFNLSEYIQSTLLSLQNVTKKKAVVIDCQIDPKLFINSFPGLFSQIMTNLVLNSMLHGFEQMDSGLISISAHQSEKQLMLKYADNGCGLSDEQQQRIFEPFYTTKRGSGGSGLGMHIVYNIVTQKLNGEIICHSQVDEGVRFNISLPMDQSNGPVFV